MSSKGKKFEFPSGLAKQFENVIATSNENIGTTNFHVIPIDKIIIENNPRKLVLSREDILNGISKNDPLAKQKEKERNEIEQELGISIQEKGLLQPIHVYKNGSNFSLIVGQRRLFASLIIGKKTILTQVWENKPDELDFKTIQWIENFNRKGLTTWEAIMSAQEIAKLHQKKYTKLISITELGNYLYCGKSQAIKYHTLMSPKADVEQALKTGKITSLKKAYELNKIKDDSRRQELIRLLEQKKITQNDIEKINQLLGSQKKRNIPHKTKKNQGRQALKVTLGSTYKILVAKEIFNGVVERPLFKEMASELRDIDWTDYKSINKAFKKLINMMELILSEK